MTEVMAAIAGGLIVYVVVRDLPRQVFYAAAAWCEESGRKVLPWYRRGPAEVVAALVIAAVFLRHPRRTDG